MKKGLPLSQAHVENEILRLCESMDDKTDELAVLAEQAGLKEAAHKAGYAKAFVEADGPAYMREQEATRRTYTLLVERKTSEALYYACKEALSTLRSQVDALRTIAANIRNQT